MEALTRASPEAHPSARRNVASAISSSPTRPASGTRRYPSPGRSRRRCEAVTDDRVRGSTVSSSSATTSSSSRRVISFRIGSRRYLAGRERVGEIGARRERVVRAGDIPALSSPVPIASVPRNAGVGDGVGAGVSLGTARPGLGRRLEAGAWRGRRLGERRIGRVKAGDEQADEQAAKIVPITAPIRSARSGPSGRPGGARAPPHVAAPAPHDRQPRPIPDWRGPERSSS